MSNGPFSLKSNHLFCGQGTGLGQANFVVFHAQAENVYKLQMKKTMHPMQPSFPAFPVFLLSLAHCSPALSKRMLLFCRS